MQASCSAPAFSAHSTSLQPHAVAPSIDEALNSSAWFQQQRFWEQTTKLQTQLLALLRTPAQGTSLGAGAAQGKRRARRNSIAPMTTIKKSPAPESVDPTSSYACRRRGSWSSSPSQASMMVMSLPDSAETDALKAMQLLSQHARTGGRPRSRSDVMAMRRRTVPVLEEEEQQQQQGKAKEAEPSLSPRHSDPCPPPSRHHERRNVMAIASLLN